MRVVASLLIVLALVAVPAAQAKVIIGEHVQAVFETPHPYSALRGSGPQLAWFDEIYFPGAVYIAPHFARFDLAPGDYVVVRSPDSKQRWTYTGYGRHGLGNTPEGFFATHIRGDRVIIELFTNGESEPGYGYKIDRYGRGYSDAEIQQFWDQGLGEKMNLPYPVGAQESLCGTDDSLEAKCYQASEPDAYDASRAVVRLIQNGNAHCTGWLVGCEGHVMTNEHCIGSQAQLNNIDFDFMAEGASCATDCRTSLGCPGTIEASGGTLVQVDAGLDYALVIPDTSTANNTDLPATYGYMRLRESGAVLNERIYIPQHPAGWGKRIGLESTHSADGAGFAQVNSITEAPCSGSGFNDVGYFADTQGGSSGSPVLGYDDNLVIALHHCRGSSACTQTGGDPNRGVPIQNVIADLGSNVPNCATCTPPAVPSGLSATASAPNQIDLSWTGAAGATSYNVYRSIGGCPQGDAELIASGVAGTSYADTTVSGSVTYSYSVTAVDDATACESSPTTCASADGTGNCFQPPVFDGLVSADNSGSSACEIQLSWNAGSNYCGSGVVYNVYRSEDPSFTPGPSSLLESCVSGTTYSDFSAIGGVEYHYIVRAEDDSGGGSGACASGYEEANTAMDSATATEDTVFFEDDMEGGTGEWTAGPGPGHSGTTPFTVVTTGAHSGTQSWFTPDEPVVKDQLLTTTNAIALPAGQTALLEFWHLYNMENNWDGNVLEISTDGGVTWVDILNGNAGRFLTGGYTNTLNAGTSANPLAGREAWSGSIPAFQLVQVDLADFSGQTFQLRWRMGCDASVGAQGWWIDDVRVVFSEPCISGLAIFADGFESGNVTSWGGTGN